MSEGRYPFEDGHELRFAPDDQIGEWEEEVERWLPEAVGYSVYDALLTDGSDLTDFMNMEPTSEKTDEERVIAWVPAESWDRARAALRRYGVDIGPHGGSVGSDTNLVSLAKRTLGSPPARRPVDVTAVAAPADVVAYLRDAYPRPREISRVRLLRTAYLADWKSAIERGRQMTALSWVFGEEGPYCQGAGRAVHRELSGARRGREGYPSIAAEDKGLLDFVVRSVEGKGHAELEKLVYSTYPVVSYPGRGSGLDLVALAREYGRVKPALEGGVGGRGR